MRKILTNLKLNMGTIIRLLRYFVWSALWMRNKDSESEGKKMLEAAEMSFIGRIRTISWT